MEGTVKWFNRTKGYGFIQGEDGNEYFVHHTQIAEGTFIRDNDRVSFEGVDSDKGKQAQNIQLLQKGSEIEQAPAEDSAAEEAMEAEDGSEESQDTEESEDTEEEPQEDTEEEEPVEQ